METFNKTLNNEGNGINNARTERNNMGSGTKKNIEWLRQHINFNGPMSDKWWEDEKNV